MTDSPSYRGRFAPSPTGPLHLGSLTSALGSWLMARLAGGEWLVRVEDLDPPREIAGAARGQIETLAAFGLVGDGPITWQSKRADLYASALANLLERGAAFACRCTRSDLAASNGIHRRCVADPSGRHAAYRLRVPAGTVSFNDRVRGPLAQDVRNEVGDVVLKRADGFWAYQLAVVVDDAEQRITEVVRGGDLVDSTFRQIQLQQMLGYQTPRYAHLPLILGEDGQKLAKSSRSAPVDPSDPLPALRIAYGVLGQRPEVLEGLARPELALQRALASFEPRQIPATEVNAATL